MQIVELEGIVLEEEFPVCPVCEQPIYVTEPLMIGKTGHTLCLIHYYCGDIEFFNA